MLNKIVELFVKEILNNKISIEDVPPKLQAIIQEELNKINEGGE